jgi:hypothetical protein
MCRFSGKTTESRSQTHGAKCREIKLKLPTSDLEVFKNKGKDEIKT